MSKYELENLDTGEVIVLTKEQYDRFFDNREAMAWNLVEEPMKETSAVFELENE